MTRTIGDRYVLHGEIAAGGMASVHLARQLGAGGFARIVAVKRMHERLAKDPDFVGMFLDEARLVARIRHPHVVSTIDVVAADGEVFLVMEYVHGESLQRTLQLLRRTSTAMPTAIAVAIVAHVLHGLHAAHEATSEAGAPLGIVHRDVSPQNILVGADGIARVLDFGVAKASDRVQTTREGQIKGKLSYMAPEQVRDEALDRRVDVYAAAVVLWEALAGRRFIDATNDGARVDQLLHREVKPPSTWNHAVSPALDAIVMRGLSRDPAARFATAEAMAAALERDAPVASIVEVSGWVTSTCATSLARRHAVIAAAESGSTSLADAESSLKNLLGHTPSGETLRPIARTDPPPALLVLPPSTSQRHVVAIAAAIAGVCVAAVVVATIALLVQAKRPTLASALGASADAMVTPAAAAAAAPVCPDTMKLVNGASFFMGSDDDHDDEKPAHKVTLHAYCMDRFEVTAGEYRACSDRGECKRAGTANRWSGITTRESKIYDKLCTIDDEKLAKHPVNCVDWSMADRYCQSMGKRLPTEAEWELAARGSDGRRYPWGDAMPDAKHLNACGTECLLWGRRNAAPQTAMYEASDGFATTAPVGSFPLGASRWGIEDLVGNVWEWTADFYGPYDAADQTDPKGASQGDARVIRGGAWNGNDADWVRPSFRFHSTPDMRSHGIGFRCVAEPR